MTKPYVTDHALLRYLERGRGFDLMPFRREIEDAAKIAAALGASAVTVGTCTFMLVPGTDGTGMDVVTTVDRNMRPGKRQKMVVKSAAENKKIMRRNTAKQERKA